MPPSCFADTSGKRDISQNDPSPKSSPSESHPVAHLYHSKPPDGGSQIPKAKSHIPSRRRQRHERLRIEGEGQARCKTGNATIPGHSIEPSSSPPPLARPPQGHLLCLSGIQATCSGQFLSSRRGCRIGASQRTKVEAHTNMHLFGRSLEVSPCPPRALPLWPDLILTPPQKAAL